jgi:prophage regulatory protein
MENKTNSYCVLRMKDLPKKIGFQPSTIYELIAKGKFPAPFKLVPGGRAAGWLESTIDAWLENRLQQNDKENI